MPFRPLLVVLAVLVATLSADPALGFAYLRDDQGREHLWPKDEFGGIYLPLVGNQFTRTGVSSAALRRAVTEGLTRWSRAADRAIRFDYWQGLDPELYPVGIRRDGVSTLSFASAADPEPTLSPTVPGHTRVFYDADTGAIEEVDLILNDRHFLFVSRYEPPEDVPLQGTVVILEDVVTHELGHALGLDHSGSHDSTMFTWAVAAQSALSSDDEIAIRGAYGHWDPGARASLSGAVLDPSGAPILGAQIVALSRSRQTVAATALADAEGRFEISGLDPDAYFVMVEPFYGQVQNLSEYYWTAWHRVCGVDYFARTFYMGADRCSPIPVVLDPGESRTLSPIEVGCSEDGGALVESSASCIGAEPLFTGESKRFTKVVSQPSSPIPETWPLGELEGSVGVSVISWGLYSPALAHLDVVDAEGYPAGALVATGPVATTAGGRLDYDTFLIVEGLPRGEYFLKLRTDRLVPELFPRGELHVDERPFIVISGERAPTASRLPPWEIAPHEVEPLPEPVLEHRPKGAPPTADRAGSKAGSGCGTGPSAPPSALPALAAWMLWLTRRRTRSSHK